ncbi:MAG: ATP-binding protein [Proteobacteria bacterium]|nr:ATP-binding protein [Pseudomonadota bacterium]
MINRPSFLKRISSACSRSPVTALLGPRQCGKTTLSKLFGKTQNAIYFDLESQVDQQRLQNPELALGSLEGLVILDEIQVKPELFNVLRVLVDQPENRAHYLILGSASPQIIKNVSQSLAGRVEFIELSGFVLEETGVDQWETLWLRGGFPRSYLCESEEDSAIWREGFIRTFLERDIPQLGITIPSAAMRRFWTMLSHFHGQTWNSSKLAGSMGLSDKTVRSYLDILTGTYMIRQLQPWYENISKRQVKAPKIYFRDSGLLHQLLGLSTKNSLYGHPQVGASWEGFVIEQISQTLPETEWFFWSTYSGAEVDLFFQYQGRRYGIEIKFNEAPKKTRSMQNVLEELRLEHLWVVYPGNHVYPLQTRITALPFRKISTLPQCIQAL